MKILKSDTSDIRYIYHYMNNIEFKADTHKRYWISEYSNQIINISSIKEQKEIVKKLDLILEQISNVNNENNKLMELYNSSFLNFFGNPNDN